MEYSHVCLEEINRFQHFNKHSFYIESEIMSSLSEKYKHDTFFLHFAPTACFIFQ